MHPLVNAPGKKYKIVHLLLLEVRESSVISCPFVLMSAKSGAGDPSGGMEAEGVAAMDADSVPVVTRRAPEDSIIAAPRSRNLRRPGFLASLCLLETWILLLSSLLTPRMDSIEEGDDDEILILVALLLDE